MSAPWRLLLVIDPFAPQGDLEQRRACALAAALAGRGHGVDLATGDPTTDVPAIRQLIDGATYRALLLSGDPMAWPGWVAAAQCSPATSVVMRPAIDERWLARWGSRPDARAKVRRLLARADRLVTRRSDGPEALFFKEERLDFACVDDDDQVAGAAADVYASFFAPSEPGREPDMAIAALDRRAHLYQLSFAQVQMLLDSGRLGEALSQLERMVGDDPERAEGHNDLAVLYHSAGRLTDAEREIRRASELDPANQAIADNRTAIGAALAAVTAQQPRPHVGAGAGAGVGVGAGGATTTAFAGYPEALRVAEGLLSAGKLEAAVAEIERFVEREPASAEAWNDLGVLQHDAGKLEAARAALNVALTIDGKNPQTRRNLSAVLLEMGRTDEAAATLEPVLAANPNDVGALVMAGDISVAVHLPGDARAFYRSALSVDPSNAEVAAKLATLEPAAPVAAPAGPRVLEYDPAALLAPLEAAFDLVRCRTPLDRLPDPVGALKEMARALKPGGKMCFDVGFALEATRPAAGGAERELPMVGVVNGSTARAVTV